MLNWIRNLWHARQRAIDIAVLWPICTEMAPDLDHAKAAFAAHAVRDPAWAYLGDERIMRIIDNLGGNSERT